VEGRCSLKEMDSSCCFDNRYWSDPKDRDNAVGSADMITDRYLIELNVFEYYIR
jgi:hypothetical protein